MSKGLGKVQLSILDYLRVRKDDSPQNKWLKDKGWCFASNIVWGLYHYDPYMINPTPPTQAQYKMVYRAISKLVQMGFVEKKYYRSSYNGKRRGPRARIEFTTDDRGMGSGNVEMLFVRIISVD